MAHPTQVYGLSGASNFRIGFQLSYEIKASGITVFYFSQLKGINPFLSEHDLFLHLFVLLNK